MRISVIGAGYVGLVTGACLAQLGHQVILVDTDRQKVEAIKQRKSPVYEPGLDEILQSTLVEATEDLGDALTHSELSFIAVSTGGDAADGRIDLKHIKQVAAAIGTRLNQPHLLVIKSTVIPGTTEKVVIPLLEQSGKKLGRDFSVCVNPEFLREGKAVTDFMNPDRIVIGEANPGDGEPLVELYQSFHCPVLRLDLKTAEMIKYAANVFLTVKLSYINEIGNICKKLDIDTYQVAQGMGYDPRIGEAFLRAGIGFGGSCLPKDLRALIALSRDIGYEPGLLPAIWRLNEEQPLKMLQLLKKHIPRLHHKSIGLLGLAFKPDTDDVRDSRAIPIVKALLQEGARIKAYDPKAMNNFGKLFPQIEYVPASAVINCDAILILTEWAEFNYLDYRGKIVIDGRKVDKAREARIYEGICW